MARSSGSNQADLVHPFDPRAPVPAGHDQANWLAVIGGNRLTVHLHREECTQPIECGKRIDPTGADDRALRDLTDVIEAADENAGRIGRGLQPRDDIDEGDAFPFGDAHQSEVGRIRVAGTLEQMRTHGARCTRQFPKIQNRRLLNQPAGLNRPRPLVIRCVRWNLRADVREMVGRDQLPRLEQRQIGDQARVESGSTDLFAERLNLRAVAKERQGPEQFAARKSRGAWQVGGEPSEDGSRVHERRETSGGHRAEEPAPGGIERAHAHKYRAAGLWGGWRAV